MGRKADRKQPPPRPMPGSDAFKTRPPKGKKKASAPTNDRVSIKAPRGPFAKSKKERQKKAEKRLEVPEDEEDSDLEEALKQGELSDDEDEETVKIKSFTKKDDGADLRGPVKELEFSDSEEEDNVEENENETLPPGLHTFDLDEAPGASDEEDMDDEFDVDEDEEDEEMEDEDEVDSAFASSNEGEEDVDMMDEDEEDEDEDGDIQTNLEDDLTNEGFTLPAVDGIVEEHEHGTSLRDVETRMRWLVGVCVGKEERTSQGVPGQ